MSVQCDNCRHSDAERIEFSIREEWYELYLCDNCKHILVNPFLPLVKISRLIDTSQSYKYAGRVTRKDIETGDVKAVGSSPDAPLRMGLRVTDGIPDLKGRVVQAKFTHDEILMLLAFLMSRPHWAHAIQAMLAQRSGVDPQADVQADGSIRRRFIDAGKRALSEIWPAQARKAG